MGAEFLESEVILLSDPRVFVLGSIVVLNTEDGTVTVEVLETARRGMEIGCDLAVVDVKAGGRVGAPRGAGLVYTGSYISVGHMELTGMGLLPSGNRPVFPFIKCLPRYHPSPKSSSRSTSSTRSPFAKLNSSGLLA